MIPKDYNDFKDTLTLDEPPAQWPNGLKCLWYDAHENWDAAHNIAQDMHDNLGSWLHAYLHRKEGDAFNAGYWYRRANKPFSKLTLAEEHEQIVTFILLN